MTCDLKIFDSEPEAWENVMEKKELKVNLYTLECLWQSCSDVCTPVFTQSESQSHHTKNTCEISLRGAGLCVTFQKRRVTACPSADANVSNTCSLSMQEIIKTYFQSWKKKTLRYRICKSRRKLCVAVPNRREARSCFKIWFNCSECDRQTSCTGRQPSHSETFW